MVNSNAVLLLRHGRRDWCRWSGMTVIPAIVAVQIHGELLLLLRCRRDGADMVAISLCKCLRLHARL